MLPPRWWLALFMARPFEVGGVVPPRRPDRLEQLEYGLGRLRGETQRGGPQRLARLQHQHVRTLFVHVGKGKVVGARLQRIDHFVGKALARGDDVEVGRQGLRVRPQRGNRRIHLGRVGSDIGDRLPVAAGRRQAQSAGVPEEPDNVQPGGGVLVEIHGEGVGAAQKVQATVPGVGGDIVDLRTDGVVLDGEL